MNKKVLLTIITLIIGVSFSLMGCNTTKKIETKPIEKENLTEMLEKEDIKTMEMPNDENEIGMIGDYAATLEVVENFNVNSFTTNHLMKTYIDEEGYLNGESYETNTLISSNDELETFTNNLKKQINEKEEIKNIKEKLTIYDETFFETKNIYIISIPTSTPACTLVKTEKLSTNIENKYDYNLIYDSDITLSLNGFVNVFFIVEVDKEISEEINTINIVFK